MLVVQFMQCGLGMLNLTMKLMRFYTFVFALLMSELVFAQTTIRGTAPAYVGKTIEVFAIDDYFSYHESLLASTQVQADSTFVLYLDNNITRKVIVKSTNNRGFLYIQPNGKYTIFFPEKDKYDPYKPSGNNVEIAFYNLDSTDINYKILGFQRWMDRFIGNNYHLKSVKPIEFSEALDLFKTNVEKAYTNDTNSYLKTYIRFSIASLDNIQFAGERNRYEKHDFYIKHTPVQYQNDGYMEYISDFYQEMMPRLPNETNESVFTGVLKSSPTLIMRALGTEYTLINLRIREMIMIKSLSEVYNAGNYPQTNIITILDSVASHSLFAANAEIAKNLRDRLLELVPGGEAPDFVLSSAQSPKTLADFKGKHLYLHFFDPNSVNNQKEISLLRNYVEKYSHCVKIVTVYKESDVSTDAAKEKLNEIGWDKYELPASNSIWKNYRIETFPQYCLIDAMGYIVASPALGPTPNGQYETIDQTFFQLQKAWTEANKEEE